MAEPTRDEHSLPGPVDEPTTAPPAEAAVEQAAPAGPGRRRGRPGKAVAAAAAVIATVAGTAVFATAGGSEGSAAGTSRSAPASTTPLTKGEMDRSATAPGSLEYGDARPVGGRLNGTLTWLPEAGGTVDRGETLYKVDDKPVALMYGELPAYRPLRQGDKGVDVRQLNENLRALGYAAPEGDAFTVATAAAVRAWQRDKGLSATGAVEAGRIVYMPGPARVGSVGGRLGAPASGEVLQLTGRDLVAESEVPMEKQQLARKGARAEIGLPGGRKVKGEVVESAPVLAGGSGGGGGGGAGGGSGGDKASGAGQQTGDGGSAEGATRAKLRLRIRIPAQRALSGLVGGAVDVKLYEKPLEDVYSVPVEALLALPGGGYGIEVVEGGRSRTVPVRTKYFGDGRVEIEGVEPGSLREGMAVGVPK